MNNKTQKYYDKNALKWANAKTHSFFHEKPFRIFESLLEKSDRVIDIGCAYGIHVPLFLGIGRKLKYSGIDISKSMVKLASSRYPQMSFKVEDILDLKSPKKFDAFWAAAILMHIPSQQWEQMFGSIERNIKAGGIGYVTLPETHPSREPKEDPRHFELFDKNKFKSLIKKRGWKVLKMGTFVGSNNQTPWHWFIVELP